jgi:hypothetical protein
MTFSTPVKIVALAALALVLGLGGILLLTSKHGSAAPLAVPPVVHHAAHAAPPVHHAAPVHHAPKVVLVPGLPPVLAQALMHRPVAVVAVYNSRVAGDRAVLAEARAGAHNGHAGFVAANVAHNGIATTVVRWSKTANSPAVLVVRRPGKLVFAVSGTTDRHTVLQAVLTSK